MSTETVDMESLGAIFPACTGCGGAIHRMPDASDKWGHLDDTACEGVRRTLGLIDQTLYANGDSSESVTWRNTEVLGLLRSIRATLLGVAEFAPETPEAHA